MPKGIHLNIWLPLIRAAACAFLLPAGALPQEPPSRPQNWAHFLPYAERGLLTPEFMARWREDPAGLLKEEPVGFSLALDDCVFPGTLERTPQPDTVDALHYDLHFLDIDEDSQTLTAEAVITLEAQKALNALDLDLAALTVTALEWEDGDAWAAAPFQQGEDRLHVMLPREVPAYGTVRLRVAYTGSPNCFGVLISSGMVFDHRGVHTFSQPWYARHWFPCIDVPWDKATASITLDLPVERTAAASGILIADEPLDASRHRMEFAMNDPVATYLMAIYVGDFVELPLESTGQGIPVRAYTYDDIYDDTVTDLSRTVDMLDFFSTIHPYPFAAYANTVAPFAGGMEHQTNSLIGEVLIRGDRTYEYLVAHEAAHQWVGDLITPSSWKDIWLNEGFATYFELLFAEHAYGAGEFETRVAQVESAYMFGDSVLQTLNPPQRNPLRNMPADRWYGFEVYNKGAMLVHMLRGLCRYHFMPRGLFDQAAYDHAAGLGDELFFSTLGVYLDRFAYGNVSSDDLQDVFEEALRENLDWFFGPWLGEPGYPEIEFDYRAIPQSPYHRMILRQTQTWAPFYDMPVHVVHRLGADTRHQVVRLRPRPQTEILIPVGGEERRLDPDPENWLLGTFQAVDIEVEPEPGVGTASPNPSGSGFLLSYDLEETEPADRGRLQVYDSRGRLVYEREVNVEGDRVEVYWDGHGHRGTRIPAGIYFARLMLENRRTYSTRLVALP